MGISLNHLGCLTNQAHLLWWRKALVESISTLGGSFNPILLAQLLIVQVKISERRWYGETDLLSRCVLQGVLAFHFSRRLSWMFTRRVVERYFSWLALHSPPYYILTSVLFIRTEWSRVLTNEVVLLWREYTFSWSEWLLVFLHKPSLCCCRRLIPPRDEAINPYSPTWTLVKYRTISNHFNGL